MIPTVPVETLPKPLHRLRKVKLNSFERALDRFTDFMAPYAPLLVQTLCVAVIFSFQLYFLYSSPDTVQSYDLQKGLQRAFSDPTQLHAPMENLTATGAAYHPSVTKRILTSFSSRSEKTLKFLLELISTATPSKSVENEPLPFVSFGMELASALYRATSWKVWFLAASMIGWVYDHDFGTELFVFLTVVQIAQSITRSVVGAPPPFWLSSSAPHQLCHSAGFSLPPENLTLCIAFLLFLNYHMKLEEDEFTTPDSRSKKQMRLRGLRIVSFLVPTALFVSTVYYGTHSLFDNFTGITFALLIFSLYRIYELHQSLNEGEENGADRPIVEIQQLEDQILHPSQHQSITSVLFPKAIFNWGALSTGLVSVFAVSLVYGLEGMGNLWDDEGLRSYPSAWKENVENNCGLKAGAASFLMSVRSFGFGYVNFANTALLLGTMTALWLRNKYHIADTSSKAHPWKSLSRMIIGLVISIFFSQLLKWWFLEAETSPFFSHRTITREEQERIEVTALHIDMIFRSIWVLALSPMLFHHMKLGHFLLEGVEEYEDEIILKEAEMKRQYLESMSDQWERTAPTYQTPATAFFTGAPTKEGTILSTTIDDEYLVNERTVSGVNIPIRVHTKTTTTTQAFPVSTSVGAVVRQRIPQNPRE